MCNGCTDDTAERARRFGHPVRVLELARGSKPLALNAGNKAATYMPRFFVDADIVVTYDALEAAARPLSDGTALAASPALGVDLSHSGPAVRAFYKIWMQVPYVRSNLVGAGIYGLSQEGLARLGAFPEIIADDMLVYGLFAPDERVCVDVDPNGRRAEYISFPPMSLSSLIEIEVRRLAGRVELEDARPGLETHSSARLGRFGLMTLNPRNWGPLVVYTYVKLVSWMRYRAAKRGGTHLKWRRDETSRNVSA